MGFDSARESVEIHGTKGMALKPTMWPHCPLMGNPSSFLQQMHVIHRLPFSATKIKNFRQIMFDNVVHSQWYLLDIHLQS